MAKKKSSEVEEIRSVSKKKILEVPVEFLDSGCTVLNLAASGKGRKGGWARGRIVNLVGDGSSGKTALALEACAQAFYNIRKAQSRIFAPVKKVIIVYNNVEQVMDFPLEKMYGQAFVDSVEWISTPEVEAMGRDFTRRVMALGAGEFLLYVVDSWDALTSEAGLDRFLEAAGKDKPIEGSYGTEKASYGSKEFFKNICGCMTGKDATLIIISQVREKIDSVAFGKKKYRAGGKALDFYTHQVAWLAEIKKQKRTFRSVERVYGIVTRAKLERNKTAKPFRDADVHILFDYGLDDINSLIDWLYGPDVKKIKFDDQEFTRVEFVKYAEAEDLRATLQEMAEEEWQEIEDKISPNRKPKFEE